MSVEFKCWRYKNDVEKCKQYDIKYFERNYCISWLVGVSTLFEYHDMT